MGASRDCSAACRGCHGRAALLLTMWSTCGMLKQSVKRRKYSGGIGCRFYLAKTINEGPGPCRLAAAAQAGGTQPRHALTHSRVEGVGRVCLREVTVRGEHEVVLQRS